MWRGSTKIDEKEDRPPRRIGQSSFPSPRPGKNARTFVLRSAWRRWLWLVWLVLALLFLGLLALAIVYGVLETRDQNRYLRIRNDIEQLRNESMLGVGFYARKVTQQIVIRDVFITVTDWSAGGGPPAYDASNGAMNFQTGVWTTPSPGGKYQVSGSVCWTVSGGESRREMIFLHSAPGLATPFTATSGSGQICTTLSVNMALPTGTTVQIQVQRDGGNPAQEIADTLTTFGIERLAMI